MKTLLMFTSLVTLFACTQAHATKFKFGFTPQGSIFQLTIKDDFITGEATLYDINKKLIESWSIQTGHPFSDVLIHPQETSLVTINASEHLVRFDRTHFHQPHYEGQTIAAASPFSYFNLLTYSQNGNKLYFAEVCPNGTLSLKKEEKEQNDHLNKGIDTLQTQVDDLNKRKFAITFQQIDQHSSKINELIQEKFSKIADLNDEFFQRRSAIAYDDAERASQIASLDQEQENTFSELQLLYQNLETQACEALNKEFSAQQQKIEEELRTTEQLIEDLRKKLVTEDPTPFTNIHIIDPQDGTRFETFPLQAHAITYGQLSENGSYLVVDDRHPKQKHGTFLAVLDLINKKYKRIQLIGEHQEENTFYKVRVRKNNVYFLSYSGKDNKFNRLIQYDISQNKLKVAYETDQDIVNYFLSPDGKAGYALLNSTQGFDLQELQADGTGSFIPQGDRQFQTTLRKIKYASQDNGVLLYHEDLKNPKAVQEISIGSSVDGRLFSQHELYTKPMCEDSPYYVNTLMVKNESNQRDIPVIYYSQPYTGTKKPLIVSLHGGPHAFSVPVYMEEIHQILSQGYNILDIN
ncbi:MAG: hypothetical protein K2W92_08895, partial [Alphaproteobacteria bacterium]|nr:hypothetical protein [Alphaproteobacteria bacterium]